MGMDPITLGALSMAAGTVMNTGTSIWNQNQANKTARRRESAAGSMMQNGPSTYETMLQQLLTGMQGPQMSTASIPTAASLTNGQAFNTGQDALMQLLRANPQTQVDANLGSMAATGMPYNTSAMFDAFRASDTQAVNEQVAGLRAGSSGLGQRFGSANSSAEAALRATLAGNFQARNAQLDASSYEGAMQRMLAANQQLTGREQFGQQFQAGLAQTLSQLGLDIGNFGLESAKTSMAQTQGNNAAQQGFQQNQLSAIAQLLGAFQNRQGLNAQLLAMMFGQPAPQMPGLGQGAMDMGQLLMFLPMLKGMSGGGAK